MKTSALLRSLPGIVVFLPCLGHAQLVLDFSDPGPLLYSDGYPRNLGWQFETRSTPLTVTALGYFDAGRDGLNSSHEVGIFDVGTQALMASLTVPSGTSATLDSWFRMVQLQEPLVLPAGRLYAIMGTQPGNTDSWVWDVDVGTPAGAAIGVTINPSVVSGHLPAVAYVGRSDALLFPNYDDPAGSFAGEPRHFFVGPNFTVAEEDSGAIPEPGTWLAGFAVAGVAVLSVVRRCSGF